MNFFNPFHKMLDEFEEAFGSDPFKIYSYKKTSKNSTTTIFDDIKVVTADGKTTITYNGEEYVPKSKEKK